MNVSFAYHGEDIASSRLRSRIPQAELKKLGVGVGKDILVYGKDWLPLSTVEKYPNRVYDVCDDHFKTPEKREYYLAHCLDADLVTCNSEVMQQIIKDETGRDAVIIPEPYEGEERTPSIGPNLLWFGNQANLKSLYRLGKLDYPLAVLSNSINHERWTPKSFAAYMSLPCMVIIPVNKPAASENRMVESIRNGKYVCAEWLQSYEPFEEFFPLGDIPDLIENALSKPDEALERVKEAQDYIRERYSPQSIAKQWLRAFHEHFNLR